MVPVRPIGIPEGEEVGTLHDMVKTYQVCRPFATLSKRQQSVRRT